MTTVAAGCAAHAPLTIHNCPGIRETHALCQALTSLGARASFDDRTLSVDARAMTSWRLEVHTGAPVHGLVYLAPALVAKFGRAVVPYNGGCQIGGGHVTGTRPVDHYCSIFRRFGASAEVSLDGHLQVTGRDLRGQRIDLADYCSDRDLKSGPLYSGASKMALLLAAVSQGTSVLLNPYPKPDVSELFLTLEALGAHVEANEDGSLVVHGAGPQALTRPATRTLLSDLIEVVTWLAIGGLYGAPTIVVETSGFEDVSKALAPELAVFERLGVVWERRGEAFVVSRSTALKAIDLTVASRGVFSDSQPFLALLAAHAGGTSTIRETVWTTRFKYAEGFRALGIDCDLSNGTLIIRGPARLRANDVHWQAPDLRAGAAFLAAALGADGCATLSGTHHLDRGYEDFPGTLSRLGADVRSESLIKGLRS